MKAMMPGRDFFDFHGHDLVRVAVATPEVRVADPEFNARATIELLREAAERRTAIVLFPELGLSAYSCQDLFQQRALLAQSEQALRAVVDATGGLATVAVVGVPMEIGQLLFNCGAVVAGGRIVGIVPKTYIPNYREFYELRHFSPGDAAIAQSVDVAGQRAVPFGTDLLFPFAAQPLLTVHVEVCEDVWVPIPPSSFAALAGATVLLNLSASNITVGKADYRRQLVANQSARCIAAYLYSAAGPGESTTDLAWDGHALIAENGQVLAESERFVDRPRLVSSEIDLERLAQERMRQTTFAQAAQRHRTGLRGFRAAPIEIELPRAEGRLPERRWDRFPYVPSDPAARDERSAEVFHIQVQGLEQRLRFTGLEKLVIGVSGGLDSTHALLVCAQVVDRLGLPRRNILAYTMPGFATGERTLAQARELMAAVGCSAHELDIRPSCLQMLRDIGHPFADGKPVYDVTFENVQAGERTSHLFRLANFHRGLVVGTGDLSELALGWCTYGVGDHMSHYAVNASVPKTLIQHVIRWVAQTGRLGPDASDVLERVLATEISPELVPGDAREQPHQGTEAFVGPYELQDFNLYYTLRFGFDPARIAFLAWLAWREKYPIGEIKRHLRTFLERFFGQSQFKRSCMPDATKVGSGGSLSPRGDWRAPSDGEAAAWLARLELVPESEPAAARRSAPLRAVAGRRPRRSRQRSRA
ncbi:MAG TPA: NAD(+) synthase [Candidatus Binatia bacterium]|nr:NAD(+) synthase [Candidatus Binatia bacterium]